MNRKQIVWLIIAAVAGTFLILQWRRGREQPPAPPSAGTQPLVSTPADSAAQWYLEGAEAHSAGPVYLGSLQPSGEKGKPYVDYPFMVALDPRGASVRWVKLAGVFDTVEHRQGAMGLLEDGALTDQQLIDWSYTLVAPVGEAGAERLPFATERVAIEGLKELRTLASGGGTIVWQPGTVRQTEQGQEVDFTLTISRSRPIPPTEPATTATAEGQDGPGLAPAPQETVEPVVRLVKTYRVRRGSHDLEVSLRVINLTGEPQSVAVRQFGPMGIPRESPRGEERAIAFATLDPSSGGVDVNLQRQLTKVKAARFEGLGSNLGGNPILWAGQMNQFFACLVYPTPDAPAAVATMPVTSLAVPTTDYAYRLFEEVVPIGGEAFAQLVVFQSDPVALPARPHETDTLPATTAAGAAEQPVNAAQFDWLVFCGMKEREVFQSVALYDRLDFDETINFGGGCAFCTIDWLARAMMWIIEEGGEAIGNYGIMIIVLVLVVRLLLHPITKKSQVNMMKFSRLAPEMEKIKQKYKDDKEAQSREMMKFMKSHGGTPILGCLPMLLQMPIWIALWSGLQAAPQLRHAGLLPFWITDLSQPDAVIAWPNHAFSLPLIGLVTGLNLLPILLAVAMFLQQKLTPMSAAATATPEQRMQQKIMMYFMTGFFMLLFYNAPSGLTLYMMGSIGGGVVESYVIRKHIKEREALEAAGETQVVAPGRAPRAARPKKPKGNRFFRFK